MTKAEIRELFIGPIFDFTGFDAKLAEEMEEVRLKALNMAFDMAKTFPNQTRHYAESIANNTTATIGALRSLRRAGA